MYLRKLASSRPWISQLGVNIPWADPEGRGVGQGSKPPWKITSSVRHSHPLGNTWTPTLVKFRLSWNKQLLHVICRGQNLKQKKTKKNTYTQKKVRFFFSVGRGPPLPAKMSGSAHVFSGISASDKLGDVSGWQLYKGCYSQNGSSFNINMIMNVMKSSL